MQICQKEKKKKPSRLLVTKDKDGRKGEGGQSVERFGQHDKVQRCVAERHKIVLYPENLSRAH